MIIFSLINYWRYLILFEIIIRCNQKLTKLTVSFLRSVVQNLNPRIYFNSGINFNSPIKDGGFLNPELNLILELKK
jgi:hypothetical protein